MNTFCASSRYDYRKEQAQRLYRFATLEECKHLSGTVNALGKDGKVANVKITSLKTWKTRPDVKVGWKFGLYEYGQELITKDDDNKFFVIEIPQFDDEEKPSKTEIEITDSVSLFTD